MRAPPRLITVSVTVLGLLPLLIADSIRANVQWPRAAVVVGGLVTSTLLTLPALYRCFAERRREVDV